MIQFRRPTRSDSYGVVDCKHTAGVCVVESEAENSKLRIPGVCPYGLYWKRVDSRVGDGSDCDLNKGWIEPGVEML